MQYLGVDLAKQKFDVAMIVDEKEPQKVKQKTFANTTEGFQRLLVWLKKMSQEQIHVAMEATGTYWEPLTTYLCEQGYVVSVINPAVIKKEAESWSVRNKTDRLDAAVIARFCLAKHPRAWVAPSGELRQLRELMRHLESVEAQKRQNENRLAGDSSSMVRESLENMVAFFDSEIKRLKMLIKDHIDKHPGLQRDLELLKSIPGISDKTAEVILSELQDVANFSSAKQVAAYAGLSPRKIMSGMMRGRTRMCKFGNSRLRRALYFPAIVAASSNAAVRAFYLRLIEDGKCKMSAIGACMRKLLTIAYGVLRTGRPFEMPV